MSDDNQVQSRTPISIALIVLLLLVVSVLAWYTFKLQKQLDQINEQQATIQSQLQAQTRAAAPIPVPAPAAERKPEPLNQPEDSNNEKAIAEPADSAAASNATEQQPSIVQKDDQEPPTAQEQRQEKNIIPDDIAPFAYDDFYRRPFAGPRWDPYAEIERMQREMDRMFDRHFNQLQNDPYFQRHFRQGLSAPEINVKENEHQYMVFVNLPGNDENDISVTLDGQRLTIRGRQDYENQNRDPAGNIFFQERRSGRFQRSITLPEPVYQNEMKTRLEDGVLKILIPKVENSQRR